MGAKYRYLLHDSEMGRLIAGKDWGKTPLGEPQNWPQSMCMLLDIMLNSKFPMFCWWGPDLLCFYNDAYRPSLGQNGKHPNILGMPAKEAWPETWQETSAIINQVLTTGEATSSHDGQVPFYRNGKLEFSYWTCSYSPVYGETGAPEGVLVVCYETTEKVVALRELALSKDRLEFAIDAAELGTFDYNPATDTFSANSRLKNWFGLPEVPEIELSHALDAIAENDRQMVADTIQRALEFSSGGRYESEFCIINPFTKKERFVRSNGKIWYSEHRTAKRFSGTVQDITSEKLRRRELADREEKFRVMADLMPQKLWTADPLGNLDYFNKSVYEFSGSKPEEIDKSQWLQGVHPDDRKENWNAWMHSVKTGSVFLFEHRFRDYKGEYRWQQSEAIPQRDADGNIIRWIGVSTDIQEHKTFTNKLEKEVEQRTKELTEKNMELEKINGELQSFAYAAGHDLQEPLRKIQIFTDKILENETQNLSSQGKNYFLRMQASAKRMRSLIQDLLAYSRANTGDRKFEIKDIGKIIAEVINELNDEIREKKAIIEVEGTCEAPVIPFQFAQMMTNLITNALKFTGPGERPEITICCGLVEAQGVPGHRVESGKQYTHVSVADKGIGFDPVYKDRIFEVFQRLNGRAEYEGTGIGLAIVKRIVANHHGFITANGEPGHGATFDIYIPI